MTMVKICGLTNLEDARWACQCGADLLGFVFVRSSPRCVEPAAVARIVESLLAEDCRAQFVGVFANHPSRAIRQIVSDCGLHLAQLHGAETPEYARALGLPVIVATRVRGQVRWDELARYQAWAYLLDSYDPQRLGGTGRAWHWDLLQGTGDRPEMVIIAGGLTPENVDSAIQRANPWGVDVSSGVEASPGRKDHLKVETFIQRAKESVKT